MRADQGNLEQRWRSRPFLGAAVRLLVVLVPVVAAVLAALAVAHLLPAPSSPVGLVVWWAGVLAGGVAVVKAMDRAARRFLPLAALLELSLLFPGRAPSRVRVARRTMRGGFERQLRRAVELREDERPDRAAEVVLGLLAALTLHDRRTRGHSERVHVFTDLIAEELGLNEGDRGRLRWAAMLHDVGKLVVPGAVLNKPAPPDEDEWAVLHRHPEEGARLIAPLRPWLGRWADVVPQHHERWDGKGYPAGLAGEDISLGARIVAVADAYEVMTAARSYRTPVTAAAAREELAACAGSQFDPVVVRAFLNVSVARLPWLIAPFAILFQLPGVRHAAAAVRHQGGTVATAGAVAGLALMGWMPLPDVGAGEPGERRVAEAAAEEMTGVDEDTADVDEDTADVDEDRALGDDATRGSGGEAGDDEALTSAEPDAPRATPPAGPDAAARGSEPASPGRAPSQPPASGSRPPGDPSPRSTGPDARQPGDSGQPSGTPTGRGEGPARSSPSPDPPSAPADADPPAPGSEDTGRPADTGPPDSTGPDQAEPRAEPAPPPRTRAVDDVAVTTQGQPVAIDVLANDEADRDAVSFKIIVAPRDGDVRPHPNRTVTYTPRQEFTGTDRFRYKICGPVPGYCSSATVTVEVRPRG